MDSESPPSTTPKLPLTSPSASTQQRKLTYSLIGFILLLLAIIIGGGLYVLTRDDRSSNNEAAQSSQTNEQGAKTNKEPLATVATTTPGLEMQLDSLSSKDNNLILNFSYRSAVNENKIFIHPLFRNKLKDSYVIVDNLNQRFNVVTDANGQPLVTDIATGPHDGTFALEAGATIAFYVTITAPPKGSVIDIFIPGAQPITDIQLD